MPGSRAAALRGCLVFFLLVFLAEKSLAQPAGEPAIQQQLAADVERLRKAVAAQPESEFWKQVKPGVEAVLDRVTQDVDAGRLLVALRGLATLRTNVEGFAFLAERPQIAAGDSGAFKAEWQRMDSELRGIEQAYRKSPRAPAAVRALGEAAWGMARPLYEASLEYAAATEAQYGLFYLGQARAAADYARFSQTMGFPVSGTQLPERSYAMEIDKLDQQVEAAYQPPLSIERHSDFIGVNAWLKRATELDQKRLYLGALYAYLEATRTMGEVLAAVPSADELAKLKEAASGLAKRLDEPGKDHSLGRLFLDLAEREIARGAAGEQQPARSARVLVEQVLPAYFAALEKVAPGTTAGQKLVTVTLVRWPFT